MRVYILQRSWDYDSSEIIGVFYNMRKAIQERKKLVEKEKVSGLNRGIVSWSGYDSKGMEFSTIKIGDCAFVVSCWEVENDKP